MDAISLFLSYNSVDHSSVVPCRNCSTRVASRRSWTVTGSPGLPWPVALEEGLEHVRGAAVFIGRDLGGWQKREMWFALDRQVREEKEGRPFPVIPVLLPGADLTPGFLFLNTWIDLHSGLDANGAVESLDAFERAITATGPGPSQSVYQPSVRFEALRRLAKKTLLSSLAVRRSLSNSSISPWARIWSRWLVLQEAGSPLLSKPDSFPSCGASVRLRQPGTPSPLRRARTLSPFGVGFDSPARARPEEIDRLREAQKLGDELATGEVRSKQSSTARSRNRTVGRLLLVADRFRSSSRYAGSDRRPFAEAFLHALGKARFALLVTVRADFYSQIITLDRGLSDRLAPAQVNIGAPHTRGIAGKYRRSSKTCGTRIRAWPCRSEFCAM